MEITIENKVAVVTGGASGIGFNIVDNLIKYGAKLVIITDINEELGNAAVKDIEERYGSDKVVFFKCDVTTDLETFFEIICNKYKNIDLLVNNAGVVDESSITKTINVNVTSLMQWSVKFYDYMRKDRNGNGGAIINIASIYAIKVTPFVPFYHASKFAVLGFTKSLGDEYNFKKTGVRVVAVCPGYTYTSMVANMRTREDNMMADFLEEVQKSEFQEASYVGEYVKEVFEKADSGTTWAIEGSRAPVII